MQNIKYTIKEYEDLTNNDFLFLAASYQELYMKMYGIDAYDAYLIVTKGNYLQKIKNDEIKKYAYNYERFNKLVKENKDSKFIFIYLDDALVGFIRYNLKENNIQILELIIDKEDILIDIINYIENLFKDNEKIYFNIPLFNIKLLSILHNLNYEENPEDIKKDMYVLCKTF